MVPNRAKHLTLRLMVVSTFFSPWTLLSMILMVSSRGDYLSWANKSPKYFGCSYIAVPMFEMIGLKVRLSTPFSDVFRGREKVHWEQMDSVCEL